jgi:hypothetical protein
MMNRIDFKKVKKPLSLNIITCDGFAYKRKEDGINVIPLNVLRENKIKKNMSCLYNVLYKLFLFFYSNHLVAFFFS